MRYRLFFQICHHSLFSEFQGVGDQKKFFQSPNFQVNYNIRNHLYKTKKLLIALYLRPTTYSSCSAQISLLLLLAYIYPRLPFIALFLLDHTQVVTNHRLKFASLEKFVITIVRSYQWKSNISGQN